MSMIDIHAIIVIWVSEDDDYMPTIVGSKFRFSLTDIVISYSAECFARPGSNSNTCNIRLLK